MYFKEHVLTDIPLWRPKKTNCLGSPPDEIVVIVSTPSAKNSLIVPSINEAKLKLSTRVFVVLVYLSLMPCGFFAVTITALYILLFANWAG